MVYVVLAAALVATGLFVRWACGAFVRFISAAADEFERGFDE